MRHSPDRIGVWVVVRVEPDTSGDLKGLNMAPRLKERYQTQIAPALSKEFNYTNPMAVPRLNKVVLNMGLGEALQNPKIVDTAADELATITGQKPVVTRAK